MTRMIRRFVAVTVVSLVMGSWLPAAQAQTQTKTPFRIGVDVGLSGLGAQIGQWNLQGAQLAAAAQKDSAFKFEIFAEDSQWDPRKAVEAFNKLTDVDHIDALIAGGSAAMQAIAPLADQKQLVLINAGAQSLSMAGIGKFTFSIIPLSNFDVAVLAKYAYDKLGSRKLAMFYVNNDTGKFNQDELGKDFEKLGGTVVAREAFRQNDTNFGAQVAKIAASHPDTVYLVGTPAELPFATKQLRAVLPTTQIISYAGLESQEYLNAAGSAANGIVYTTTFFDPSSDDPEMKELVSAYKAAHGGQVPASPYVGFGWDAVNILATALKEAGGPGEKLRAAIMKIRRFPGVTGTSVFRDDGTVAKAIAVKQIKDGKFELITVVQP